MLRNSLEKPVAVMSSQTRILIAKACPRVYSDTFPPGPNTETGWHTLERDSGIFMNVSPFNSKLVRLVSSGFRQYCMTKRT